MVPALLRVRGTQQHIPVDVRDEAELWAREWGRHATIEWHPVLHCPMLVFERMGNDPMRAVDERQCVLLQQPGEVRHPRTNRPMPGMVAMDLAGMGAAGIRRWLDEHNLFSNRSGLTLMGAIDAAATANGANRKQRNAMLEEGAREDAWLAKSSILGITTVPVAIDLTKGE